MKPKLMGIDIGTTHIKVSLFEPDGTVVKIVRLPTNAYQNEEGNYFYKPEEIWRTVVKAASGMFSNTHPEEVVSIGISSMAEAGVLIDKSTGEPKSEFIPWFDMRSVNEIEEIIKKGYSYDLFCKTGLQPSFKYGLMKLMWIKKLDSGAFKNVVWLSASDYIAFRLTGEFATDYSLAVRTYVFDINDKKWDEKLIKDMGFSPEIFPNAQPSGTVIGKVNTREFIDLGMKTGIPVVIAGQDHVCAAFAVGAVEQGSVMDSIGTAESLIGAIEEKKLGMEDYNSGLCFGCHVVKDRFYWLGGLPSSGGSIEWIRTLLSEDVISYDEIELMLEKAKRGPTGLLYFPYLSGSGAPLPDLNVRGALIGLEKYHGRNDVLKAIFEGTSYEMESIRRMAEKVMGLDITHILTVGGGAMSNGWMQIRADVLNCKINVWSFKEATLLGAAMLGGIGCGIYKDERDAISSITKYETRTFLPDSQVHKEYERLYEKEYLKLQKPIREYYKKL